MKSLVIVAMVLLFAIVCIIAYVLKDVRQKLLNLAMLLDYMKHRMDYIERQRAVDYYRTNELYNVDPKCSTLNESEREVR